MINNIGIMQGRLVPREIKSRLQSFPKKNWKKEFSLAKKYGIKFIEWTVDYKNFNFNPIINNLDSVIKVSKKEKINITSVTADFFMQKPFFKKKNRNVKTIKYLKKLIVSCNILKIKYIILPLVDNSSINNLEEENIVVNELLNLNIYLKSKNLKILFEIDYKPKKISKFINRFNNNFGINYDTGNSASLNFSFKQEKKYFSKVYNIHVKDRELNGPSVRLGQGNLKIENLLEHLNRINYKGKLILQTFIPKSNKNVLSETLINYNYLIKKLNNIK